MNTAMFVIGVAVGFGACLGLLVVVACKRNGG